MIFFGVRGEGFDLAAKENSGVRSYPSGAQIFQHVSPAEAGVWSGRVSALGNRQ
jgi:hypothetical protein